MPGAQDCRKLSSAWLNSSGWETLKPCGAAGREVYADSDQVQCRLMEALGMTEAEVHDLQLMLRRVVGALDQPSGQGDAAPPG